MGRHLSDEFLQASSRSARARDTGGAAGSRSGAGGAAGSPALRLGRHRREPPALREFDLRPVASRLRGGCGRGEGGLYRGDGAPIRPRARADGAQLPFSHLLRCARPATARRAHTLSTALGSFTSYAVSFTLGFPILTGGTVRYWIYAPKGMSPGKVASLTVIAGFTFWLGMGTVLAWSLMREAGPLAVLVYTNIKINQLAGLAAAVVVLGYL